MPANWGQLELPEPPQEQGRYDIWIDTADPKRNSAAMVAVFTPPGGPLKGRIPSDIPPEAEQGIANAAADFARLLIGNVLPGTPFELEPETKNGFSGLNKVTAFNSLFHFKATVGQKRLPMHVSVMITVGANGVTISSVRFTTRPIGLYFMGTANHADFVQGLLLQAQRDYWD